MKRIDENTLDERAQRCLEAYLRGRNEADMRNGTCTPLSPAEIAETYEIIRAELKRRAFVPS